MLGYWLTGECRNIAVPRRSALSPLSRKPYAAFAVAAVLLIDVTARFVSLLFVNFS